MRMLLHRGVIPGALGGILAAVAYAVVGEYDITQSLFRFLAEGALTVLVCGILGALLGIVFHGLVALIARLHDFGFQRPETMVGVVAALSVSAGMGMVYLILGPQGFTGEMVILAGLVLLTIAAFSLLDTSRSDEGSAAQIARWLGVFVCAGFLALWLRAVHTGAAPMGWWGLIGAVPAAILIGYIVWYVSWVILRKLSAATSPQAVAAICVVVIVVPVVGLSAAGLVSSFRDFSRRVSALPAGGGNTDEPNIILISVDTLRADSVGYMGSNIRTPALDALAETGHVFSRAYSVAPWTRPSFAAFLSSRYPSEMGVGRIPGFEAPGAGNIPYEWRDDRTLLPEIFQKRGYTTAAVVTNANITRGANADQGFDFFYNCGTQRPKTAPVVVNLARALYDPDPLFTSSRESERAPPVSNRAIELMDRNPRRPLFLWLHYLDPHSPYDPPTIEKSMRVRPDTIDTMARAAARSSPIRQKYLQAYAAEIEYCDDWLATMIEQLKHHGLWDSSVIVLWSDHGEEFWEHGGWEHGQSLFNELVHVPLIIRLPGQTEGRRIDRTVTLLDPMPTILDYCDADAPAGMQGRSLVALMGNREDTYECSAFLEGCDWGGMRKGLLTDRWKLIYNVYRDDFSLYDMVNDHGERNNIYGTSLAPDMTQMERRLLDWTERASAMMQEALAGDQQGAPDAEIQKNLRDMGYIQ